MAQIYFYICQSPRLGFVDGKIETYVSYDPAVPHNSEHHYTYILVKYLFREKQNVHDRRPIPDFPNVISRQMSYLNLSA